MRRRRDHHTGTHNSSPTRWAASLLLHAALAVAVVGCSSSNPVSSPGAGPSATLAPTVSAATGSAATGMCDLFTGVELRGLFGQDLSAGEPDGDVGNPNCRWEGTVPSKSASDISRSVTFKVASLELTADAQAQFDTLIADKLTRVLDTPAGRTVQDCFVDHVGACSTYHSTLYLLLADRYVAFDISNYATPADFTDEQIDAILAQAAAMAGARLAP
ncbi:MAG: hypothetical protein WCC60_04135 [Ilumatobacteraceae bacterium]